MKYVCDVCGWIYDPAIGDPDNGVPAGTKFEDVPATWSAFAADALSMCMEYYMYGIETTL